MNVRNASVPAVLLSLTLALSGCSGSGESTDVKTNSDTTTSTQPTTAPIVGENGDVSGVPEVTREVIDGNGGNSGVTVPGNPGSALDEKTSAGETPAIPEGMMVHAPSIAEGFFIVLAESAQLKMKTPVTSQTAKRHTQSDFKFLKEYKEGDPGWKPFFSEVSVKVTEKAVELERQLGGNNAGPVCKVTVDVEYKTQGGPVPTVDDILKAMTCVDSK
jgi:hypothetical protein